MNVLRLMLKNILKYLVVFFLVVELILPPQTFAQLTSGFTTPKTMIGLSPAFTPVLVKGIKFHPDNAFHIDFVIHPGDDAIAGDSLKTESNKLIRYFLAALTTPDTELWVNLSPYESDRIMADSLSKTQMGATLLEQDYLLKQITSSLMFPEEPLGRRFWERVYREAKETLGVTEIPLNTLNKVWIVPETATIFETAEGAFLTSSRLKVLMEEDYKSGKWSVISGKQEKKLDDSLTTDHLALTTIKEILIPALEKEVNEGKNFADLRQMTSSVILASWFKQKIKQAAEQSDRVNPYLKYIDQNKIKGIESATPTVKEDIYQQYVNAFKKGVYDYVKEEYDPNEQTIVSRHYFSGGLSYVNSPISPDQSISEDVKKRLGESSIVSYAMLASGKEGREEIRDDISKDKDGATLAEPQLQVSAMTVGEIEQLTAQLPAHFQKLDWKKATEVLWDELVREPKREPVPQTQNQLSYFNNQILVRKEILVLLADLAINKVADSGDFIRRFRDIHTLLVTGNGQSFYYSGKLGPDVSPQKEAQSLAGVFPDNQYSTKKLEFVERSLRKFLSPEFNEQSRKKVIQEIAEFYEVLISGRNVFPYANHSWYMHLVNVVLRLNGLNGIANGYLDEFVLDQETIPVVEHITEEIQKANPQVVFEKETLPQSHWVAGGVALHPFEGKLPAEAYVGRTRFSMEEINKLLAIKNNEDLSSNIRERKLIVIQSIMRKIFSEGITPTLLTKLYSLAKVQIPEHATPTHSDIVLALDDILSLHIENVIDAYLHQRRMESQFNEPLDIHFYVYSKEDNIVLRVVSNGMADREEKRMKTEEKAAEPEKWLGGLGEGVESMMANTFTFSGIVRRFDRRTMLNDTDGSVLELTMRQDSLQKKYEGKYPDFPAMHQVNVPANLRKLTTNLQEVTTVGSTVRALIDDLEEHFLGLRIKLLTDEGKKRSDFSIIVLEKEADLDAPMPKRAIVNIMVNISGGVDVKEWPLIGEMGIENFPVVKNGMLKEAQMAYAMAYNTIVNPQGKETVGINAAAGADFATTLYAFDPSEVFNIEKLPVNFTKLIEAKELWDDIENPKSYDDPLKALTLQIARTERQEKGFWQYEMLRDHFEYLVIEELKSLGLSKKDVSLRQDEHGNIVIEFFWAYPGRNPKKRTFTYIQTDMHDPLNYLSAIQSISKNNREGYLFDFYYQKSAMDWQDDAASILTTIAPLTKFMLLTPISYGQQITPIDVSKILENNPETNFFQSSIVNTDYTVLFPYERHSLFQKYFWYLELWINAADSSKGGIDLNPSLIDLQHAGENQRFVLPMSGPDIDIEGLVPVFINITPVTSVPQLLGMREKEKKVLI